jgi:hypothetical protein
MEVQSVNVGPDMPFLRVLRDFPYFGAKFGISGTELKPGIIRDSCR